jgi:hypothetical protein
MFAWRRQYQRGVLKAATRARPGLLAVRFAEAGTPPGDTETPRALAGIIQMELPRGRLRLTGCVEREALRVVLEALQG